jgi:hypothetical protein
MYLEEICLSAAVDDPEGDRPPEDPEEVAFLEQTNWMRRCRSEFTLFDNQRLSVKTQGLMQQALDYTLNIGVLDPQPKRLLKICWSHALTGVALCAAAWLVSWSGQAPHSALLSLGLGAGAGLILILAIFRSHDRLVFYSRHGRVPLVILFNRLPDRETLDEFANTLARDIKTATTQSRGMHQTLSEELKEHRRLMETGVISGKRYDIAKRRILGQHSSGRR